MKSSPELESKLLEWSSKGEIVPRTENNQYLKVSYLGAGKLISPKWNVKIYTSGSIVCNDLILLKNLMDGYLKKPDEDLTLLQVDDAGVGFPLCGIMVGITDGKSVLTDTVDVSYFKPDTFDSQEYLRVYAQKGYSIISEKFHATPKTHRIEICTGFVNTALKDLLRQKNYDVRVTEIKGLLQDTLENLFREHVKEQLKGADLCYDPKEYPDKSALGRKYYAVLNWGKKYAPHMLKSGWKSMQ